MIIKTSKMPKILIVDDEPDIVDSIKAILEMESYEVTGVNCGSDCLEKLKEESFDLVLMDFFMPEMDGRMVIEKIRENPDLNDTKIVFLTSATFKKKGMEVIKEMNVSDYIPKMDLVDTDNFVSKIKKVLKG